MRPTFVCLLVLSLSASAWSQTSEAERRSAARDLGLEANRAFDAKDYSRAADLYRRADTLYAAPTLSVRLGRALVEVGKLVEAEEAYIKTVRYPLPANAPQAFKDAVQVAKVDLAALSPRVPRLLVAVKGAEQPRVTLNGVPLEPALIGVERKVDPGAYRVRAEADGAKAVERQVVVKEGKREQVKLQLVVTQAPAAARAGGPGEPDAAPGASRAQSKSPWPWVALGVGTAGVGLGVVAGLMASSRHASAEAACPDLRCERGSSGEQDLAAFRDLRSVSTIGYVVGAVSLTTFGVLLLTAPKKEARLTPRPFVGLGNAGVWGQF